MDDNANTFGEFGESCYPSGDVRELAAELTCPDFAVSRLLSAPLCQVYEPKVDVLVVHSPSLILLDAISIPTIAEYCG
jgi:hypothetical protein